MRANLLIPVARTLKVSVCGLTFAGVEGYDPAVGGGRGVRMSLSLSFDCWCASG